MEIAVNWIIGVACWYSTAIGGWIFLEFNSIFRIFLEFTKIDNSSNLLIRSNEEVRFGLKIISDVLVAKPKRFQLYDVI